MVATELRIGNYLDRNGLMEVRVISQSGIKIYDFINKMFHPNYFPFDESLKPIPLTEEWLMKFGFEKKNKSFSKEDKYIWYTVIEWRKNYGYIFKGSLMKYVHQLQNLYFALTGSELQIK